jgi:hypothetical protein
MVSSAEQIVIDADWCSEAKRPPCIAESTGHSWLIPISEAEEGTHALTAVTLSVTLFFSQPRQFVTNPYKVS